MREVGFRAMRMDGKGMVHGTSLVQRKDWVKGLWVHRVFLLDGDSCNHTPDISSFVEVKPDTLGQSTGLRDKDGKEIYAGDICRFDAVEVHGRKAVLGLVGEVQWDEEDASFYFLTTSGEWPHIKPWFTKKVEVIGNIHENPELLEAP